MDEAEERELRKEIAEQAAGEKALEATIFTRAFQFFLVPAIIVGACAGVYWLLRVALTERRSPADLVEELRHGGPVARKHAAMQLDLALTDQARQGRPDPALVEPILRVFTALPPNEAGTDPLTRGLVGEGPSLRAILANCLGLLGDRRATPALLKALREEDSGQTKAACIDALGALRDPDAADDLIKLLDHPSSIVRKYATFTVGAMAAPQKEGEPPSIPAAVEPLKARLRDARPEVQWNAAFVLAYYLRDGAGAPVLRRMLDRAHVTEVVTSSFKEPGDVGRDTAANAPALIAHVMAMGCRGVEALRDPSFAEPLAGLAEKDPDPDPGVREAARRALKRIREAEKN